MKKTYSIEGLDCADCTAKLERKLAALDGVDRIGINFITQKCTIEAEEDVFEEVLDRVVAFIKKEEPDVEFMR